MYVYVIVIINPLNSVPFSSDFQMFLEFCDGGALDSILVDLQKGLTEAQIAYVTHQICVGLGHLHRCAIIHRDLKAGQ